MYKLLAKVGGMFNMFNIIYRGKTSTLTYCLYNLVEFSITLPAIYVTIKKYIEKVLK